MFQNKVVISVAILFLVAVNDALRILVVFPLGSKSHSILGNGVVNNLLDAGHEVVFVTPFKRDKPVPNLKEVYIENILENARKANPEKFEMIKLKNVIGKPNFADSFSFHYFTYQFNEKFLKDQTLVDFLSDPNEKFDAVILEWFFADVISGIAPLFQCPLIWLVSTEAHWQPLKLIDEVPNTAYTIDLFSKSTPPLTFWERTVELWTVVKKYVIVNYVVAVFERLLYNRVFTPIAEKRAIILPSYDDAIYNASLMFFNSHPSMGTPFKLPQNAIYIGGYHIDNNIKPLPKELQKRMDEAKHGVIYFSMGSNLKSKDMSIEMRESLLKMFSQLKQTVIWKFEIDLENVPANVHLVKWAPQQSILSHPNLKFFITHGGQLSTTESIHHGVPVIGLPIQNDQHVNMKSVSDKGFGITVSIKDDVADKLFVAILEMLSNSSYKARAKELSAIYHDRPVPPGKELVHWVEHVGRTRGAPHLRSPALQTPLYQKMYLDFAAIIFLVFASIICFIKRLRSGKCTSDSKFKEEERKKKLM